MAVDPNVDSDGELSVNKQHAAPAPAAPAPAAPAPAPAPQPQPQPPAQVGQLVSFARRECVLAIHSTKSVFGFY